MPSPTRLLFALVAILVLTMAACSGGTADTTTAGDDSAAGEPGVYEVAPSDDPADVVADPGDPADDEGDGPVAVVREPSDGEALPPASALALSAERSLEPESFRGTYELTMDFAGLSIGMDGEYVFEAPNSMYMTISILGESIDMLMILPDLYVRVPGEGWYYASAEDVGVDWEEFVAYAEQRGPIDFQSIADGLYGVAQLPDETIDGVTYLRYGGTLDLNEIYQDMPEGLMDPALLGDSLVGDVHVDLWLYKDSYLPHRVDITIGFGDLPDMPTGGAMEMSMVMFDYNEPVDIPDAPANAQPIDLLGY